MKLGFQRLRGAFAKIPRSTKRRLESAWAEQLDELVSDLSPAFVVGSETSLLLLVFRVHPAQDDHWRRVHDSLNIITAWFQNWDAQRRAVRGKLTPEILIIQIEGLSSILLFASWAGEDLSKWARALPVDDLVYKNFKVASQRYDAFLTKYESFLRKLPKELGLGGDEQFFTRDRFFSRISI